MVVSPPAVLGCEPQSPIRIEHKCCSTVFYRNVSIAVRYHAMADIGLASSIDMWLEQTYLKCQRKTCLNLVGVILKPRWEIPTQNSGEKTVVWNQAGKKFKYYAKGTIWLAVWAELEI